MKDPDIVCPNMILALYEELLSHAGYGDIHISVRMGQGRKRDVRIHCGKEYHYLVDRLLPNKSYRRYKVVHAEPTERSVYTGREQRSDNGRRNSMERRKTGKTPRSFRLDMRKGGDRRLGRGRRRDD